MSDRYKERLPDELLTEHGKRMRRSEKCRGEYGISFEELAALIAMIARWRCGEQATKRADIADALAEFEATVPGFDTLRRLGLAKQVSNSGNVGVWAPSKLALVKFASFGVRPGVGPGMPMPGELAAE